MDKAFFCSLTIFSVELDHVNFRGARSVNKSLSLFACFPLYFLTLVEASSRISAMRLKTHVWRESLSFCFGPYVFFSRV